MNDSNRLPETRRGFTMIEMLVTLAITIVLMLFVGQIFSHVSDAARSGIAVSHVLENARVITSQISDDASNMVGPTEGGFLIIDISQTPAAGLNENDSGTRAYYSDQLMWVRLRGDLEPVKPGNDNTFANSADDAAYVRVYYGHGLHLNPNSSSAGTFGDAGLNEYASNWVLSRHAMFLAESPSGIRAATPGYGGAVTGMSGDYLTGYSLTTYNVRTGLSDVADMTLAELNAATVDINSVGFGAGTTRRPFVNVNPAASNFEGWAIAQQTGVLALGISDMVVEYANVTTGSGPITWVRGNLVCTQSTSNWPDLIRIRFRIQSPRGTLIGADGEPGVMYERIISVKK